MDSASSNENSICPNVTFIVLNWNGWEDTIECLKSIDGLDYPNYHIILVDNASHDDSLERIRNFYGSSKELKLDDGYKQARLKNGIKNVVEIECEYLKSIELANQNHINSNKLENLIIIKNNKNYGFTGGNNIALNFAHNKLAADYYLLLNNDTVVDPQFLKNMMKSVGKKDNIGFAGPKIYYFKEGEVSNLLSFAGGTINLNTSEPSPIGVDETDNGQYDMDRIVDYVEGSCMLVSKELVDAVGLFNPDYFTYWEEIDWCIRGKKLGFNTLYSYDAKIWHKCYGSDTGARSIYFMIKNRFLFMKLNESRLQMFTSILYYFCYFFWKILFSLAILHRDKTKLGSFLRGTSDGIKILLR